MRVRERAREAESVIWRGAWTCLGQKKRGWVAASERGLRGKCTTFVREREVWPV